MYLSLVYQAENILFTQKIPKDAQVVLKIILILNISISSFYPFCSPSAKIKLHISVCGKRPSLSLETGGLGDSGHTRGGPDRSGRHPGGLNSR
jgi:hypothetical protein